MRLDSNLTTALYKSFTYLLTYLEVYKNVWQVGWSNRISLYRPDGVSCVRCSATVSYIDPLKYFGSSTKCIQLELNGCWVCVCQHSNAADSGIGVVCVRVQRVDELFKKSGYLLDVVSSNAARWVDSEHDVWSPRTVYRQQSLFNILLNDLSKGK